MKKIIIVLIAGLLSGCGSFEWFPAPEVKPAPVAFATYSSTGVGVLTSSVRNGPGAYTIVTTTGAFSTYTSLGVPAKTSVTLELWRDKDSHLMMGKLLKALTKTVLVKEVLYLLN